MEEVFNGEEFEYAGFWARFFATVIDTVIINNHYLTTNDDGLWR